MNYVVFQLLKEKEDILRLFVIINEP